MCGGRDKKSPPTASGAFFDQTGLPAHLLPKRGLLAQSGFSPTHPEKSLGLSPFPAPLFGEFLDTYAHCTKTVRPCRGYQFAARLSITRSRARRGLTLVVRKSKRVS